MLLTLDALPVGAAGLLTRLVPTPQKISGSVIAGRARCAGGVWLLNGERQLIKISQSAKTVTVFPVRGLDPDDRPWGLACLSDDTVWTLANPRALARLSPDGAVVERVKLQIPWVELFGAGDRLLFEQAPPVAASPVLATSRPSGVHDVRPWPGLLARAANTGADFFINNLVNCGLTSGSAVPCWFPGDTDVILSDGTHPRRHSFPWIRATDVDSAAPLRDVAFVDRDRVWLLATSSRMVDGRRVGGRLFLGTATGRELARVDLDPPARLVLFATDASCLLVTVRGDLLEVRQR